MLLSLCTLAAVCLKLTGACEDHDWTSPITAQGVFNHDLMQRHDLEKRIQPNARPTLPQQIKDLHWGQLNILSTTDTHGWLAGHLLDDNYSADYGDFADFVRKMKAKADVLGVDLLLVDSGDLHDGTGLGDATTPNGRLTLPIFKQLPYDLLSIGNHELYTAPIANNTYRTFAPAWGGRYVTSNVYFYDNGVLKPFSQQYAYYQTKFGIRVMSFGFLFNFTGNTNTTVVTPVGTAVNQTWFQTQVRRRDIDMFIIAGHVTIRQSTEWNLVYAAIRAHHPTTPIHIFGGHRHTRDAVAFDAAAIGTAAGRYCETVGWLSVNGLPANVTRANSPYGSGSIKITRPSAVPAVRNPPTTSNLTWTRQYLDFNRPTFVKHTASLRQGLDTTYGLGVTKNISDAIATLPILTDVLGCSPGNFYLNRYPITNNGSLFHYLTNVIFPGVVYAQGRQNAPRIILTNTGGFRSDLLAGPFTIDNAYQVNPYQNLWQYTTVPYSFARDVLLNMQTDPLYKRQTMNTTTYNSTTGLYTTAGYVTVDDFGNDGDNTIHINQGFVQTPRYVAANVSTANITDGNTMVDVYVTSFFARAVAKYLPNNMTNWINVTNSTGGSFASFDTMPAYARQFWSKNC